MRTRLFLLALASAIVLPIVLAACGKPMENKELDNPNRDNTNQMMKKAGGDSGD